MLFLFTLASPSIIGGTLNTAHISSHIFEAYNLRVHLRPNKPFSHYPSSTKMLLALHFAMVLSLLVSQVCGIINGRDAAAGELPWVVAIETTSIICAGTILSARSVLTTADCVNKTTASSLSIRYGSLRHATGGSTAKVNKVIVHPSYDNQFKGNLAILVLSSSISPDALRPAIDLATLSPLPLLEDLRLAGWGPTETAGTARATLKVVDGVVVERLVCELERPDLPIDLGQFCDRGLALGSGGVACGVDAGGSITRGLVLVGLMMKDGACGVPGRPELSVDISQYRSWVLQNII